MKRTIVAQRLPHLFLGCVLTTLLVASAVVLPAAPAQAADHYLEDESVSEDLSFKTVRYNGEKDDLAETYETEDSKELCEKLKRDDRKYSKENADLFRNDLGITHMQLDNCIFVDSLVFLEYSGQYDEDLLKKISSEVVNKINDNGELTWVITKPAEGWDFNLGSTRVRNDIGIMRYRFPGKIKSLHPNAGKVSGNTWTLDDPPSEEEEDQIGDNKGNIIITAERHSSNLGLILGITIPVGIMIVAVIVLLIVRSKRKKKQQPFPPYPAGYGTYPPPPFMPGNSPYPVQSPVPGYPAAPGVPGIPGAAPYPPNVSPQGQPAAPTPGSYYPYQYPYPPTNPQGSPAGHPMPPQGYGTPSPGFQPPATPPQSEEPGDPGESGQTAESHSGKHIAHSPLPGQSGQPAKSLEPAQSRETGEPGNSNDSEQELPSSKPRHAAEPAQADLTVLKTDSSELIAPKHQTSADQAEPPGHTN